MMGLYGLGLQVEVKKIQKRLITYLLCSTQVNLIFHRKQMNSE